MILKPKNISIPAGDTESYDTLKFPVSQTHNIIGVMFKQTAGDTDKNVNIKLSNQNKTLIDYINIDFLAKSTDGFKIKTAMPLPPRTFSSDDMTIELKADAAITNEFKGQLVFILEKGVVLKADGNIVSEAEYEASSNCPI